VEEDVAVPTILEQWAAFLSSETTTSWQQAFSFLGVEWTYMMLVVPLNSKNGLPLPCNASLTNDNSRAP
jgi:hypothetical protein